MARKSRKNSNNVSVVAASTETLVSNKSEHINQGIPTAAYIRLSIENSGHETDDTLQTQILLVESYIKEHSEFQLIDTFIDNGVSGTRFDRPEFVRMMEAVKCGNIKCIVVKDLSRFGRDYLETGYYLESIFPLLNVRFIAITDNYDSSREQDRNSLSIPIKNLVNAMYAKDYSRKQEAFRDMCIKTGRVMGINAPYGYSLDSETGRLAIDTEVEPYVRMIFAWSLSGVSRKEVARRLELIGAPTPAKHSNWDHGYVWKSEAVRTILFNPAYAGFHVMGKSKSSIYKGIKTPRGNRDKWIYFPDYHEPYITMEDYQTIQEMITKNKNIMNKRMEKCEEDREVLPDLFPGLVYCAECGRRMRFYRGCHNRGYENLTFRYYRCKYKKGEALCENKKVQQNYLQIVVWDQICNLIKIACDRNEVLRQLQDGKKSSHALDSLKRKESRTQEKIESISEKLTRAYMDFAEGLLSKADYELVKDKFNIEKNELLKVMGEVQKKMNNMEAAVRKFQAFADVLKQYDDTAEFSPELVKELVSKVWVSNDGGVEIVFKCEDVFKNALLTEYIGE